MEILKGFEFQIQRFTASKVGTINLSAGKYTLSGAALTAIKAATGADTDTPYVEFNNGTTEIAALGKTLSGYTLAWNSTGKGTASTVDLSALGEIVSLQGSSTAVGDWTADTTTATMTIILNSNNGSIELEAGKVVAIDASGVVTSSDNTANVIAGKVSFGIAVPVSVTGTNAEATFTTAANFSGGKAITTDGGAVTVTKASALASTLIVTKAGEFTTSDTAVAFGGGNDAFAKVNGISYKDSGSDGFTVAVTTDGTSSYVSAGDVALTTTGAASTSSEVGISASGDKISIAKVGSTDASAVVTGGATPTVTDLTVGGYLTMSAYSTTDTANVSMNTAAANDLKGSNIVKINGVTFKGDSTGVNSATFVARSASQVAVIGGTGNFVLDSTVSSIRLAKATGKTAGADGDVTVTYSGSSSGSVSINAAGVVTGLEAGETITVTYDGGGTTTYSVADDVLTAVHTVGGVTTSQKYTLSTSGGSCGVSALLASTKDVTDKTQLSGVVDYQVPAKYSQLSSNGTATLAVLENGGTQVFNNTGTNLGTDIYATLARATNGTYTLTTNATASALTGLTVDFSALGSSAVTVTNNNKYFADDTVYRTANGAFTTADTSFNVAGDVVSGFGAGANGLTITSGTLTIGDTTGVDVTTSIGTLTITDGVTTTTKVTSAGAVTGIESGGKVALTADATQDAANTTVLSINGRSYTAVTSKGAEITYTGGTTWNLTSGSLVVAAGGSQAFSGGTRTGSVKVTGGDGVIVDANGLIGDLENGETVTLTDTTNDKKYVYTVVSGVLQIDTYATAAATTYTSNYYNLTGEAISTSTATYPLPTAGEYTTAAGISIAGTAAVTDLDENGTPLYVDKTGKTSLTEPSNAVATITRSNDVVTYTAASTAKGQTVVVASDANGYNNAVNWSITTTNNADTVTYGASSDATISTGTGKDTVTVSSTGEVNLNTGDGNDNIMLTGAGTYNVTTGAGKNTVSASGAGEYVITAGEGGNLIDRSGGTDGNATITGGTGKDTITAAGLNDAVTGGDGADTFNVSQKSMTIKDYVYGTDVLRATTNATAPAVTVANYNGDGTVVIASGTSTVDVSAGTGTGDFYAVSLVDSNGKNKKNVAWAKDGGSTIDITTYDQAVTLIGNADGANALYAGTKADDIYSYADNDSVYGGAGKDYISLASGAAGRVVGVATTGGKDTVSGFKASFEEGDSIFMVDGSAADVKASFANNTVTFKDGDGSLQLNGVSASSTTGAVELNVSGTKVALAAASVGGAIAADSTSYANFYMGNKAGVSFATAEGEVNVDLRNGLDSGAEGAKFSGIIAVSGGAGQNTLIGGTAGETLTAGTGTSSLWGGAGKDTLVGNGASDAFFIGAGDGSDVVLNFSAAGNENADTVYALNDITGAKLTSNGVEISVGDTDKLTLKNVTADTAIKFNSNGNAGVAKVGSATTANNFSYDSTVTYYGGGSKSDKIAFASGSTDNAQIWLDGSQGKAYASIDVVDGTNTSGNLIVAGDSSSQSLIGGKGDTSLWGGAGSVTDTLKSSSTGKTMFWWGAGEGNDLVVSASADDSVNLYNLKLSDVDGANSSITNSGVVLALNDGSKLTVQTSRDMTFSIDGQSWTAQHSSKEWKQNS